MYFKTAKSGYIFVLTTRGYNKTPDYIKHERCTGMPVNKWSCYPDNKVPVSWIAKGYVEEVLR